MPVLAAVGLLLIILAVVHVVPLVVGIVVGAVLILIGGVPFYGRGRRPPF